MSITASRFGSTPLLLDWSGIPFEISPEEREKGHEAWQATLEGLRARTSGFYDAVIDPELSQVEACRNLSAKFRSDPGVRHCVFIGIGGSSLGPICLTEALRHRSSSPIEFHFFENPDPIDWNHRISRLKPEETLLCVVTKSGTTYETISLFMLAWSWMSRALGSSRAAGRTVAITDPVKGELLEFAKKEGIATLEIAPSVGGRFSVFTPVGLFAAGLAGLDLDAFLLGGKKMRDYCERASREKNLYLTWGLSLHKKRESHPIHVMMPYSTPLKQAAFWWVQLWSESLGKDGKGYTAVPALGAVDQHSMLQLLRDGPADKVIWFLNVLDTGPKVPVPSIGFRVKTFDLLEGQDLGRLLDTEFRAIQRVMKNRGRPALQIQLDSLNEESMGALFFALSVLTAYSGRLLGVDPFDQPGVEEGKVYIRETLEGIKKSLREAPEGEEEVHRLRLHRE
jgi:glucose-6-phosphate isomerase